MAKSGITAGGKAVKEKKSSNEVDDPRFAAARSDPRFQRFPKSSKTVDIDERFAGMFKDKAFQVRSAVDKRGRKIGKAKNREDMRKYYRIADEQNPEAQEATEDGKEREGNSLNKARPKLPRAKKQAKTAIITERRQDSISAATDRADLVAEGAQQVETKETDTASSESGDDEAVEEEDARAAERWARVRGLVGPDSSSSSSDPESDTEASEAKSENDAEEIELAEWGVGAMAGNPDEAVPEVDNETSRLAILDLDWSKIKAADIFAMLKSFLKKGQQLKRVTVYPSNYGLQRMAEEARFGPRGLAVAQADSEDDALQRNGKQKARKRSKESLLNRSERDAILETLNEQSSEAEDMDEDGSQEEDASDSDDEEDDALVKENDDPEAILRRESHANATIRSSESEPDNQVARRKLQLYERSRLRYYYAIADCADVATARHLYNECDGMEFEHSASLFDLRYVPDAEDFSEREVRESATSVPTGYRPPEVGIAAMLHTNPKLTWDAEDEGRKKMLLKRVTKDELRDDDFKAYLGSDSSEGEDDRKQRSGAERYRQLLTGASRQMNGKGAEESKSALEAAEVDNSSGDSDVEPEDDQGMEMEVTFGGGLDSLSQRLREKMESKVNKKKDTVWQSYLRRREERRRESKSKGRKAESEDDDIPSEDDVAEQDPYFQHKDDAFDDPFFKDADDGVEAKDRDHGAAKKKGSRAVRQGEKAAAEAQKHREAQLELLLMDEKALQNSVRFGAKMGQDTSIVQADGPAKTRLSKKARLAAKKAAKGAKKSGASDEEDLGPSIAGNGFNVDVSDQRFNALFTSADFALDPTDPRYQASEASKSIQREAAKRRTKTKGNQAGPKADNISTKTNMQESRSNEAGDNPRLLVASLKRKGAARQRKEQRDKRPKAHEF